MPITPRAAKEGLPKARRLYSNFTATDPAGLQACNSAGFSASPVAADDKLYLTSEVRDVYVIQVVAVASTD